MMRLCSKKYLFFFNVLNNDDFLKKYINLLHKPTYLIEVESSNSNIILRSKKRVGSSKFHYQNFKHLSNMIKYKNKIKKIISKKNKLITLKNNYNYFKQIDKFYETIK